MVELQEIIIHFGPHKTATTSIQSALSQKAEELKSFGVFIPQSALGFPGFHELPWSIKEWDTRFISNSKDSRGTDQIIEEFSQQAKASKCTIAILSSEDFSILSLWQLNKLIMKLRKTCLSRHGKITLVGTKREIETLKRSAYAQLIRLGLNKDYDDVERTLERHFRIVFTKVKFVAKTHSRISIRITEYEPNKFVETWLKTYISPTLEVNPKWDHIRYNESPDVRIVADLQKINVECGINWKGSKLFDWTIQHSLDSWKLLRRKHEALLENYKNHGCDN